MEREKLWVCERCLAAIESHEGDCPVAKRYESNSTENEWQNGHCDWCEDDGFDKLYVLI